MSLQDLIPTLQGAPTPVVSPAALEARRQIAQAMMREGGNYSPIASPWQGVARVTDAIMGGLASRRLDQQELAGRQAAADQVGNIFSQMFGGGATPAPSSGGSGSSSTPVDASAVDPTAAAVPVPSSADAIFQGLTQRGLDPVHAAALAGNWQQESNFNPGAWNPKEGAGGLDQWRERRLANLQAYAKATGRDWQNPETQMDFSLQEMGKGDPNLPGFGAEAQAGKAFLATSDLPGANAALRDYIRYGDNTQPTRLAYAQSIFNKFGNPAAAAADAVASGQMPPAAPTPPVEVASLDPSAGVGAAPATPPLPPDATKGDRVAAANAPDAGAVQTAPAPAGNGTDPTLPASAPVPQPSPAVPSPNGPAAPISPLGQRLLMDPHALSGDGGVLPPAPPPSSGAAGVAAAMNAPASSPAQVRAPSAAVGGIAGSGRGGMDAQTIAAVAAAMGNPWMSPAQEQLLGGALSARLTPHKIEMVPLGNGDTAEVDSITGQQVGMIHGVRPPVALGYDQRLVDPANGQQLGGAANGQLPFRFLSPEEKAQYGFPADTPVQVGPDGKVASNGVTVNTGTPQSQYSDEMAKGLSGPHMALESGVEAAQEQLRDIHAMQAAAQQIEQNGGTTGMGQPEIMKLQSAINTGANLLGVDQPFDISDKEFLTKFNRQIAGAQAKSAAGARVTNFELKNYLAANPGLEMSPQGNARLLGIQSQMLQRNVDVGQAIRSATANAVAQGKKVNPAQIEQIIRDYDDQHHVTDPITGQDLTKDVKLKDLGQPGAMGAAQGAAPSSRPRATNPQTGKSVEWDGTQWVPVQ